MKPTFGDAEQIKQIKDHQREAERKEKLNTYEVCISFSGDHYITIDAENEEEAEEEAKEDFLLIDADGWDIDHITTSIIKEAQKLKE